MSITKNVIKNTVKEVIRELSAKRVFEYPDQVTPDQAEYKYVFAQDFERYWKLMQFLPEMGRKSEVLEVGTGIGYIAVLLRRLFDYNVTTIEHPSRDSLKNTSFIDGMKKENINVKSADILNKLEFPDGTFDMIIFSEVIEHLAPTPTIIRMVFNELSRILRKNGNLVVTTPNVGTIESRIRGIRGISIQPFPLQNMSNDTYEHLRIYSVDEIKRIIEGCDCEVQKVGYSGYRKGKLSDIKRIVTESIYPAFGADMMVLGEKKK
ncbi:MAG: hypothetical protein A2044_02690 [Candidatus Firestonebacteria bacterium GWA2_43_8]|nr:MAG: hypothetical protein A2044_02690 [Candidatus Firestonebacteria bacterium GWA2_43_8]